MRTDVQTLIASLPVARIKQATRLGLILESGIEPAPFRDLLVRLAQLTRSATGARQTLTAWLGDALAYGGPIARGQIAACAAAAGLEPGTLRNAKMICTRIPVSRRHDALSWSHHCEIGLVFADSAEIDRWLALAEAEKLATAELRQRIRVHQATSRRSAIAAESAPAFRLMRELRATARTVEQSRTIWKHWPPSAAQLALAELTPLVEFINAMRARVVENATLPPGDTTAN